MSVFYVPSCNPPTSPTNSTNPINTALMESLPFHCSHPRNNVINFQRIGKLGGDAGLEPVFAADFYSSIRLRTCFYFLILQAFLAISSTSRLLPFISQQISSKRLAISMQKFGFNFFVYVIAKANDWKSLFIIFILFS